MQFIMPDIIKEADKKGYIVWEFENPHASEDCTEEYREEIEKFFNEIADAHKKAGY